MSPRRLPILLTCALAAASARATSGQPDDARMASSVATPRVAAAPTVPDASVRRWEYVILVRTAPEVPDALGRAELAALRAGGAVLEDLKDVGTGSHQDWRILVRTRDESRVHEIVKAVRATRGVLGATAEPLPETPTYPGGPSFLESWTTGSGSPGNADRVVMRHDVPPIADKRELLEMTDVASSPSTGPERDGGFTLNVSELFARMKEGSWRRREERLRNTPIAILPPAGETTTTTPAP